MTGRLLATLATAIVILGQPVPALACTCICAPEAVLKGRAHSAKIKEKLENASIVFLGRVTSVGRDPMSMPDLQGEDAKYSDRVATIQVIREWKGSGKEAYELTTSCCSAGCGYPFELELHLFFLHHNRQQILYCCPDPSPEEVRASVRALDRIAGKKPLLLPKELR